MGRKFQLIIYFLHSILFNIFPNIKYSPFELNLCNDDYINTQFQYVCHLDTPAKLNTIQTLIICFEGKSLMCLVGNAKEHFPSI